jgi:hypothetical protein
MTDTLTQERLKELLRYDPDTGIFTWLKTNSNRARAGSTAGCKSCNEYIVVRIDGVLRRAHRLAWLYMTGSSVAEIDHANRDKSDNRWANLRAATRSQNNINRPPPRNNRSGFAGVHEHRPGEWHAFGMKSRVKQHIGAFRSPEEASAARAKWAVETYGEFADA